MGDTYVPLTEAEIDDFFDDLDSDKDGYVTFDEVEAKLHKVRDELVPNLQKHRPLHPSYRDVEQQDPDTGNTLHTFLCYIMPECGAKLSRMAFTRLVQSWEVPSQKQNDLEDIDKAGRKLEHHMPRRRRLYAYWAVRGPEIFFITCVVLCMTSFGTWQMVIYMQNQPVRQALGWGVILAKTCAGVLYPTLVFMLLSTSRHLSTWIRYYSYPMSRAVNWDYSQKFHIIMNCAGLFFATLHAIGHLAGSMIWITNPAHRLAVSTYFGTVDIPQSYIVPLRSLPGWTGVVALGLFWTIALFSLPWVRKRSYEIYQCGHLLMFPMIGLLCAHGTSARLQAPMLGYFLALPSLLVIYERVNRFVRGCIKVPATMKVLDNDAVTIICKHPSGKAWRFSAGQYVLLQVPRVSFFQWHPFTISKCRGSELQVHIKMERDWTRALKSLLAEDEDFYVGIDGPFGAPAQRFYNFDYSIVIGGGIGITPFAAILNDLEESFKEHRDPWKSHCSSRSVSHIRLPTTKPLQTDQPQTADGEKRKSSQNPDAIIQPNPERRVDFQWTVREKNNLLWFSDLLNRAIDNAGPLRRENKLEVNINTYITASRKDISTHIFRFVLDRCRTQDLPYSALTGLKQNSHFGRPNYKRILERHFQELVGSGENHRKVGVFYCGTPMVKEILSKTCHELTARARDLGLKIRYDLLVEVFG